MVICIPPQLQPVLSCDAIKCKEMVHYRAIEKDSNDFLKLNSLKIMTISNKHDYTD